MSTYITQSDITDNIVGFDDARFDLKPYLAETDKELVDLADRLGILEDDIEDDPLHFKIKRYGICYCLMRLCQDKSGTNDVEVLEQDKYLVKYNMYKNECESLRPQITPSMFDGSESTIKDRVMVSGVLWRG